MQNWTSMVLCEKEVPEGVARKARMNDVAAESCQTWSAFPVILACDSVLRLQEEVQQYQQHYHQVYCGILWTQAPC